LDIDKHLRKAVQSYWDAPKNEEEQGECGKIDAGARGDVTGGTQMGVHGGFGRGYSRQSLL
jgi:hypothetical protein